MVKSRDLYAAAGAAITGALLALVAHPGAAIADPAGRGNGNGGGGGGNGGGGGGSGGGLEQAAEGLADVIAKSVGAILTSLLAAFGLRAFMRRDFGEAIGLVAIGILVGTFAFHPDLAERFIKGTAEAIL